MFGPSNRQSRAKAEAARIPKYMSGLTIFCDHLLWFYLIKIIRKFSERLRDITLPRVYNGFFSVWGSQRANEHDRDQKKTI